MPIDCHTTGDFEALAFERIDEYTMQGYLSNYRWSHLTIDKERPIYGVDSIVRDGDCVLYGVSGHDLGIINSTGQFSKTHDVGWTMGTGYDALRQRVLAGSFSLFFLLTKVSILDTASLNSFVRVIEL